MAQVTVFDEPEAALVSVFWQEPRPDQVATDLDDGVVLIEDGTTGEPIGMELPLVPPRRLPIRRGQRARWRRPTSRARLTALAL